MASVSETSEKITSANHTRRSTECAIPKKRRRTIWIASHEPTHVAEGCIP